MSLKPLRANTLLNAKMERVQQLAVVEMCAWLSSPRVAGGKEEEGERKPPGIYQDEKRLQFQTVTK